MFSTIDKNLLIAALESAIFRACKNANIISLHAIEMGVSLLRQKFDADPATVSDDEIFAYIQIIQNATIPTLTEISLTGEDVDISNKIVSFLWENLVGKPATFPPSIHSHPWSQITYKPISFPPSEHTHPAQVVEWNDITDKPTTFEPATHAHDYASITDKPTTFEPATHAHDYASITDKPTTFEPATHAHDYASITDKPTTFEPATHAHDYASITDKPTTFEPATHLHQGQTAVISWSNGILGKPETFPPDAHNHSIDWTTQVINKQATYPPSEHTHPISWGEVSGKPSHLKRVYHLTWTGDGTPNRVLSLPFALLWGEVRASGQSGVDGRLLSNGFIINNGNGIQAATITSTTITFTLSTLNTVNAYYSMVIYGDI